MSTIKDEKKNKSNEIISEEELADMFGEGGKEGVKEFYEESNQPNDKVR
jgi:hypothetical protein